MSYNVGTNRTHSSQESWHIFKDILHFISWSKHTLLTKQERNENPYPQSAKHTCDQQHIHHEITHQSSTSHANILWENIPQKYTNLDQTQN